MSMFDQFPMWAMWKKVTADFIKQADEAKIESVPVKRKPGRPPGSKNKPKEKSNAISQEQVGKGIQVEHPSGSQGRETSSPGGGNSVLGEASSGKEEEALITSAN
jgi:hypothetical protein